MAKIDLARAKADIAQILEIVKTVPEALQERCFELLFEATFKEQQAPAEELKEPPAGGEQPTPDHTEKKLPSNVLAFVHRYEVTREDLKKLFMLDHDPLLPIYKLPSGNVSKAQISKVMMILLENGLLNNSLSAPYPELRDAAKDDGLHDSNFNKTLKRNHALFRGAISKDAIDEDGLVELTGQGMTKLAEVIKELAQ